MTVGGAMRAARHSAFAEEHIVHAIVVVCVVICATVLRALGKADNNTVAIVYAAAIAYAAGRSGTRPRTASADDA